MRLSLVQAGSRQWLKCIFHLDFGMNHNAYKMMSIMVKKVLKGVINNSMDSMHPRGKELCGNISQAFVHLVW